MPRVRNPVERHPTSVVRPADFDSFWADILATVDRVPLNPSLERIRFGRPTK
jgi:cephalosporin-C deacetylase-like acetyl esterase